MANQPAARARLSALAPAVLPRRQWLAVALLAVIVTAAFLAGLWNIHATAQRYLDAELGIRLRNLAVAAAATVQGDSLLFWDLASVPPVNAQLLESQLARVAQDNALSRVAVYALDGRPIVDTSHALAPDVSDPFLKMDAAAVEQARAGEPGVTTLLPVGSTWIKAAYAPVLDGYHAVSGFLGVEASADFFTALAKLRRALLVAGATLVTLAALLTAVTLATQLRLARARAALIESERLSAMGRMAAGIAHEIRNPLSIIKNTAQLLRSELPPGTAASPLLEFIPEEVDRLNEILSGYLSFAREAPARPIQIDLAQLLARTLRVMAPDCAAAQVRVLDNLQAVGQVGLTADPQRLQQVFLNLFLNAVQAMPQGGELRVQLRAGPEQAVVEVTDTGVGFDPADREHLFEPFVTTKEKGSGLGLALARQIVTDHGGTIAIDGQPGRGATVTVQLPRAGGRSAAAGNGELPSSEAAAPQSPTPAAPPRRAP